MKLHLLIEALDDPRLRSDAIVYVDTVRSHGDQRIHALHTADVDENGDLVLS
jgi:hypothetical protein